MSIQCNTIILDWHKKWQYTVDLLAESGAHFPPRVLDNIIIHTGIHITELHCICMSECYTNDQTLCVNHERRYGNEIAFTEVYINGSHSKSDFNITYDVTNFGDEIHQNSQIMSVLITHPLFKITDRDM
jgi:hypothetical protein